MKQNVTNAVMALDCFVMFILIIKGDFKRTHTNSYTKILFSRKENKSEIFNSKIIVKLKNFNNNSFENND